MHNITSPRTDDAGIEQEIQAKGLIAPRVTPADIEANIATEAYFTAHEGIEGARAAHGKYQLVRHNENEAEGPMRRLTFCVLILDNGFTVTGESACASPENFDAEIGRKIARANAVDKVWPLMGYALKERLSNQGPTMRDGSPADPEKFGVIAIDAA